MNKIFNIVQRLPFIIKRSLLRFFLSFTIAVACTIILFDFSKIRIFIEFLQVDIFLQHLLVFITEHILNLMHFETYSNGKFLQIIGQPGVSFEFGCLGIRHFFLFSIFILSYFGKIHHKIYFILLGNLLLIFANSLRAVIINIAQYYNNDLTQITHDISTPMFMYLTMLILWFSWINIQLNLKIKIKDATHQD